MSSFFETTLSDRAELIHINPPRPLHIRLDDLHLLVELSTSFLTGGFHHSIPLTLREGDVASRHLRDIFARLATGISRDETKRSIVLQLSAIAPRSRCVALRDAIILRRWPDLILVQDVAELVVHHLEEGGIERLRIIDVEPVGLIERNLQAPFGGTLGDRTVAIPRSRSYA